MKVLLELDLSIPGIVATKIDNAEGCVPLDEAISMAIEHHRACADLDGVSLPTYKTLYMEELARIFCQCDGRHPAVAVHGEHHFSRVYMCPSCTIVFLSYIKRAMGHENAFMVVYETLAEARRAFLDGFEGEIPIKNTGVRIHVPNAEAIAFTRNTSLDAVMVGWRRVWRSYVDEWLRESRGKYEAINEERRAELRGSGMGRFPRPARRKAPDNTTWMERLRQVAGKGS